MKKILILVLACAMSASPASAQALRTVFKLLTGTAAAAAVANAAQASEVHDQKLDIVQRLKKQGVDPINGAIYSVYYRMDSNANAVYWSRIFGKPDVYAIVAIEGHGTILIPRITYSYAGQPILDNLFEKYAEPGRKICIYIFDDHSVSNAIWNNIMQSKVSYNITSQMQADPGVDVTMNASGEIQLLRNNMVIDASHFIAYGEFVVPQSNDETRGGWLADGTLSDANGNIVGRLQFAEVWKANPEDFKRAVIDETNSKWNKNFWIGISVVLVIIFASQFGNKKSA